MNKESRENLAERLFSNKCRVFAEIGVLDGSTLHFLMSHPENTIKEYWAIDLWRPYETRRRRNYDYYANTPIEHWDTMYANVCKYIFQFKGLHVLRLPSLEASLIFPNNCFDVVLIDADHAYESVIEDIDAWIPLIKENGIICGDDWCPGHPGVRKAVTKKFGDDVHIDKFRMWWHQV